MKKLITLSLFIFWAVVVAILAAGLVNYQNNKTYSQMANSSNRISFDNSGSVKNNQSQTLFGNQTSPASGSPSSGNQQLSSLSLSEISKHNSTNDCWLLINNNIYNVTGFLSAHPGGASTIIPYCGKEATQAFNTKDIGRPHSGTAANMLADYYIGTLNQTVNSIAQVSTPQAVAAQGKGDTNTKTTSGSAGATKPPVVTNPVVPPVNNPTQTNGAILNMTEIAKHNSRSDCWLLINNKVYNVTSFLSAHPGGASTITPHCGQEATQAFNTKDIGRPHSGTAASMLASYYIGDLNQTTSQQQIQQNVQNTNTVVPPTGGGREGEDD